MPRSSGRRARSILACLLGVAFLVGSPVVGLAGEFDTASVHFEQNATDGDVEVVFKAKGGDEGLAKLRVVAPDGRTVIDFTAPDPSTLGIRQFEFESPEPPDVEGLKAAYPEGVYRFSAATVSGEVLSGESTLSHTLPATAVFVHPSAEAEDVGVEGLEISWVPVAGVSAYIVEIENDDLEVGFEATLPGSASTFRVPDGFLTSGTEYDLAIGTVSEADNISFVETSFTTAE